MMKKLFQSWFGNPTRRKQIVVGWNVNKPVPGDTLAGVFQRLIETILYCKIDIVFSPRGVELFRGRPTLSIKYTSMTEDELTIVKEIFENKSRLFAQIERYQHTGGWKLCKYKKLQKEQLFTSKIRRDIVRDFVFLVLSFRQKIVGVRYILIDAVQNLIETKNKRDDLFIKELIRKLQHIGDLKQLLTVYEQEDGSL
jgi:hypothetical protein